MIILIIYFLNFFGDGIWRSKSDHKITFSFETKLIVILNFHVFLKLSQDLTLFN